MEGIVSQEDRTGSGQCLLSPAVACSLLIQFIFVNSVFQLTRFLAWNILWKESSVPCCFDY